ncbi:ATP synthase F1 subunit epsilon [Thermoflavifilum thermophilum]|uniref:F-type H+-transporting ATPase subunit epsilon n=1 Tax=Thermoflavifilum thermophilum TaxID=1393122 RepID=A0A1I7N5P8_9BACT|nr:ATP synthase F1 subunit epsilon [Thermoflavifilum thermophilum]SFV29978.1 F-type H+-transporting ATPase subunit epsilon [Thermoflavifilum thermophilum]
MLLEIYTPERKVFEGEVYGVQMPGLDGLFEVLNGHAPLIAALAKGRVKILQHADQREVCFYQISGGFVEVLHNQATILAESAVAEPQAHSE